MVMDGFINLFIGSPAVCTQPDEFCHRHIAGEAISEKYGIEVQELGVDYNNYELKDYKIKPKGNLNEDEW